MLWVIHEMAGLEWCSTTGGDMGIYVTGSRV